MANFQTVVDPRTNKESGYYRDGSGQFYTVGTKGEMIPASPPNFSTNAPPSSGLTPTGSTPQASTPAPTNQIPTSVNAQYNSKGTGIADLVRGTFGDATSYRGKINSGYQQLGQPEAPTPDREGTTERFITNLASVFADKFYQQTGGMPSEEQMKDFVSQNATQGNAAKFITGNLNDDALSVMSKEYITSTPGLLKTQGATGEDQINKGILGLNDMNRQLYEAAKAQTGRDAEEAYVPQKRSLVEDLAAQNQLGQANSRYSLDALEGSKQRSLASALGNINIAQAQGGMDIGRTAQQLLANQRGLNQQASQFGITSGLDRRRLNEQIDERDYQRGMDQQQLTLARMLGQQQADANEPGWLDYLNTGINAATTVAGVATANPFLIAGGASGLANGMTKKKKPTATYSGYSEFA